MNILLVDDERLALRELEDAVRAVLPDAACHSFQRAREALAFAAETPIEIAFLDINMRVVDGLGMARELQALYPKINLIFCTGYTEYALDALNLACSYYLLKPITEEKVRTAIDCLRYPLPEKTERVLFRCFGNFEVFCDNKPVSFKYNKTKELLAYLVDRNGAIVSSRELMAVLFENEYKASYFSNLRLDLLNTFKDLGVEDTLHRSRGHLGIVREKVACDYFDFLDGKTTDFRGEYMSQFIFAETTCAALTEL